MIILLYILVTACLILFSPILFMIYYPFSQLYLFYFKKIKARLLLLTTFIIALFWHFFFHYYFALLVLNSNFKELGIEVFILNDPWILTTLIGASIDNESIFRTLFVETCVVLHIFGQKLNLTITILNI